MTFIQVFGRTPIDTLPLFKQKFALVTFLVTNKAGGRGVYKTSDGSKINVDCNGAANILRKVVMMLEVNLSRINKGCLSQPKNVRWWTLQKSPVF